ncbi:MAG TPA: SDR family oxidoreductase [Micromonosporaceae bacterium]
MADEPDRPIAGKRGIVTGATSGIGAAFARRLATDGYDLVLVARDEARLAASAAELSGRHGVTVRPYAADLSTPDGCAGVEQLLGDTQAPIDILVNSAGLSLNRSFVRSTMDDEERLLHLNVHAVMRLTHAAVPGMVERRHGAVVNVASVSGFGPVMPGSTYPASKAWVINFSESVGAAVRPFGVRVMALCPGYTRTEFHQRAGIDMSKTPRWLWLDADDVVREAMRDVARGKRVSVPDWRYKVAAFGIRYTPRALMRAGARDTRGRIGRTER